MIPPPDTSSVYTNFSFLGWNDVEILLIKFFFNKVDDGREKAKSNLLAVDEALVPCFVVIDHLDRHVRRCCEGRQGVAHESNVERLYVLDRQHVDVLEDVPVGTKFSIPVVDAGVDARLGLHISCYRCRHLHDMLKPKLSNLIFEEIENFSAFTTVTEMGFFPYCGLVDWANWYLPYFLSAVNYWVL